MKEIGNKLSKQELQSAFNKLFEFFGVPAIMPINLKVKNHSFFYRYRVNTSWCRMPLIKDSRRKGKVRINPAASLITSEVIVLKVLQWLSTSISDKISLVSDKNNRILESSVNGSKWWLRTCVVIIMKVLTTRSMYKCFLMEIKLNTELTMPLKFYVRLLSLSPTYINKQVLE